MISLHLYILLLFLPQLTIDPTISYRELTQLGQKQLYAHLKIYILSFKIFF